LDYFVTLSNAMLPLGFHSVGELGIKEIDTNSARFRFEDYHSPGLSVNWFMVV